MQIKINLTNTGHGFLHQSEANATLANERSGGVEALAILATVWILAFVKIC